MTTAEQPPIDPVLFREVMGHYPTGVALVTAIDAEGEPVGMTVGSFTSVSLDPPLVAFLPMRTSRTFARLRTAQSFAVNVLAHDQESICRHFARGGEDKFAQVSWSASPNGSPVIDGAVATIDCTFAGILDGGDHHIVLGAVQDLRVVRPERPLLFFQGGYGSFASGSRLVRSDARLAEAVADAQIARPELEALAARWDLECTAYARVGDDFAAVASAGGENTPASTTLGSRVPLKAPLGDFFVAWGDRAQLDAWMQNAMHDDELVHALTQRLAAARTRGWSAAHSTPLRDQEVGAAIRRYADAPTTPAQHRELGALMSALAREYAPVSLETRDLPIATLSAPVRLRAGGVPLVLTLSQLPASMTAAEAQERLEALLAACARVAEALDRKTSPECAAPSDDAVRNYGPTVTALANALAEAERTAIPIPPLTETAPDLSIADAYAVQKHNIARRISAGERIVGWKIGLTSVAMQEQLGVDEPDFGAVTDHMVIPNGADLRVEDLIAPRIEAEYAFFFGKELPPSPTRDQIIDAISGVGAALEVIDSRIVDWRIGLRDTIADNASCARIIYGEFINATPAVLASLPATVLTMFCDDDIVAEGPGSAVLEDPLASLEWLARAIGEYDDHFRAGDVVLAGAVAAAVTLSRGRVYSVKAPGFPPAALRAV